MFVRYIANLLQVVFAVKWGESVGLLTFSPDYTRNIRL